MPFGITNAPSTFQCAINDIFRTHLRKSIVVFFDHIMVYSQTVEQHINHLELALQILRDNFFYAKTSKCLFGKIHIMFSGHLIFKKRGLVLIGIKFKLSWSGQYQLM